MFTAIVREFPTALVLPGFQIRVYTPQLSPMAGDPLAISVREAFDRMRRNGCEPIGVISYDGKDDTLLISLLHGVDGEEVNALLEKFGLKGVFK